MSADEVRSLMERALTRPRDNSVGSNRMSNFLVVVDMARRRVEMERRWCRMLLERVALTPEEYPQEGEYTTAGYYDLREFVRSSFESHWGSDSFNSFRYTEMFECTMCCNGTGLQCIGDCCKCDTPHSDCDVPSCTCCMYAKAFLSLSANIQKRIIKQF